jgi:hypothetical protein
MTQGRLIVTWQDARLFAAAAGAAWFWWRRGILGTILAGMAVFLPLRLGWAGRRLESTAAGRQLPRIAVFSTLPPACIMNVLRFRPHRPGPCQGKRVFIRADLNVPQDDAGRITEDTRIRASVPCIRMALDAGAAVMVTSHLGRPTEGEFKPEDSLAPVAARLAELLGRDGAAGGRTGSTA